MKKILFLIILLLIPLNIYALEYPKINSDKAIVYDLTSDKILYEKNSNEQTNIASLTKIMTTITAIEKIDDLNEEVIITEEILDTVSKKASIAGLKKNDKVTYEDLLYASMLPSGADATNTLAISLSGSIDNFVKDMNNKAKELGMKDTHFVNVTGLDEKGHYSTANDISILLKYSLKNKLFKEIFTTRKYKLSNKLKVESTINKYKDINTSKILGSKTGYTKKAGLCLATLMEDEEHEIIVITINANNNSKRNNHLVDNTKIINFVEDNYNYYTVKELGTYPINIEVPVIYSKIKTYNTSSKDTVKLYLPKDYDKNKITTKITNNKKLSFLNKKGDKIATIEYYYDNELFVKENVYLKNNIDLNILSFLIDWKIYLILFIMFMKLK
jgi:D-alanyl-D-alanine carboxypeptidase (penicillin-binding protein 5/6)